MKELIRLSTDEQGQHLVDGRELHEALKVQQDFSDWMKKQLDNIDAIEGEDFTLLKGKSTGGRPSVEYILTLDTAKEVCMVVGVAPRTNEVTRRLSKEIRKYFIECEKKLKENKPQLSERDSAILMVMNSSNDIERVGALKHFEDVVTKPLIETIEQQAYDIEHKEDVIISLTKDVTIAEKRQRINDIVRYGAKGRYSERWSLLYKEFDSKLHINTSQRLKNAKERGEVKKSMTRMDYICEVLKMTNELFDLATVVFEADYIAMLQDYLEVAQRN